MAVNFKVWFVAYFVALPIYAISAELQYGEKRLNDLINEQLKEATASAESQAAICLGGTALLPADLFSSVELTDEEKRVTLLYSLARNQWECRKREATELLVARHLAREAGLPVFSVADDPQGKVTGESILGLYSMLGYKARYLAIAQVKRTQLEQIEALKRPFDLIGSARVLGIYPEH